jgi:hypothetical protein
MRSLIANSAALVAPPDSAVSGGSLNGRLTTPIGGGPVTARLTRREDRSAQLGRGPENLGNRAAANYRFLNGSAASAVLHPVSRGQRETCREADTVDRGHWLRLPSGLYISSHDAHWRRSFEQRRGGGASQRGETGHQHAAAAPILADAEAERAARIKGAGSHGQDSKLVWPLGDGVSARTVTRYHAR